MKERDEAGERRREGGRTAKAQSNAIVNCIVRQVSGRKKKKLKHTALLRRSSFLAHHLLKEHWHWAGKITGLEKDMGGRKNTRETKKEAGGEGEAL